MNNVNRETLLHQLESVQPGLSSREIIEQSSCFVFKDGNVITYNDEVACTHKSALEVTGAVQAGPLVSILRKLPDDDLSISVDGGELVIEGKRRRAALRLEAEVLLPVDKVEKPGKWRALGEDFLEAINLVQHCASKDESQFQLTCIHLHPDHIEACDNFQVTRVRFKTGVAKATLVRRDSIKHIVTLGMTEFSESETWIHFRNPGGLVLSCRRYMESFPDTTPILSFKGHPITLPKGLGDAADRASVFSGEAAEDNQVLVELRTGKLRVKGIGASGSFQEIKKLKYDGPALAFQIAPELLIELTKKHNDAEITEGRLRVDGGKWSYVTCLSLPSTKDKTSDDKDAGSDE